MNYNAKNTLDIACLPFRNRRQSLMSVIALFTRIFRLYYLWVKFCFRRSISEQYKHHPGDLEESALASAVISLQPVATVEAPQYIVSRQASVAFL